jgi:integrase
VGNWLTPAQGKLLLERSDTAALWGKRNHAILAMLIGCGLRRSELLSLAMDSIQVRKEHWVIADLKGRAGHVRTVPVPQWVKAAVDVWSTAAEITKGTLSERSEFAYGLWRESRRVATLRRFFGGLQKLVETRACRRPLFSPSPLPWRPSNRS